MPLVRAQVCFASIICLELQCCSELHIKNLEKYSREASKIAYTHTKNFLFYQKIRKFCKLGGSLDLKQTLNFK